MPATKTAPPAPKVGVYVCHCGINIAGKVDVNAVVDFAKTLPNVTVAREYKFMCSDPGQELIQQDIRELGIDRVVVASCSPLMHESTFRKATETGGQNEFLFQMANIREHVSWVTKDRGDATKKSKALVAGAVARVSKHTPLERRKVPVHPDVLVVGGGIAGIHAALTMANAGKKVTLVEREPTIGGHMAMFDKTFPTLDCAACILTPKMSSVKSHPNITLRTYSEVDNVEGYVGNFKVKVRQKPRYIHEDLCVGCSECIEKCVYKDAKFPDEFNQGLGNRKPVYIPFPQATPLVALIDPETCITLKRGKCKQTCVEACQRDAIDFTMKEEVEEIEVGSIVIATGFKAFNPKKLSAYGYGMYPNVYTSLELERLVNASGPTQGEILLKDGGAPKSVGIIHCVGSRDTRHHNYCSRVCCMYSLKLAHLVRERTGAEVYNFYIDMRAAGKGYEEFYDKLLHEGVHFVRGRAAEVTPWANVPSEEGKLIIRAEDSMIGTVRRVPVDMVVLSVGMEPQPDAEDVRRKFSMSCSSDGWFMERHPKLAPVNTFTDGVFLAGACQSPKDIPDTVAQAGAAAAEALALIDKGYVQLEPNTAFIDEATCSGCHTCIPMCPYTAIAFDAEKKVAVINEALCKGCGTCVGACPSGSAQQNLFTDEQIYEEIKGVLNYA